MSVLQEAGHIKNRNVLIFPRIICLHLMYSEVAWVLSSSATQVKSQIRFDPYYFLDYLAVSYGYVTTQWFYFCLITIIILFACFRIRRGRQCKQYHTTGEPSCKGTLI